MLTLNNITAGYGARTILNQLNLTIHRGEFVHILGENGAGKSTLFSTILGKLPYSSGSIDLDGKSTSSLSAKELASSIAYVSQNTLHGTVGDFTIQENMEMALLRGRFAPLLFRKADINHIKQQLSLCELGLENRLSTKASDLSGGQRQALSLIMALQQMPKVLLLDEHTSALDPNTATRIMALTHSIVTQHNITCVMITHNLQEAIQYGDRIIILHEGTVAKEFDATQKTTLTHHKLIDTLLNIGVFSC
jgi:putative ABC transport system ATP-binding protein